MIGRRCSVCSEPAKGKFGAMAYCRAHEPPIGRRPLDSDIIAAREAMANGASLKEAARRCGLMAADLDLALWQAINRPLHPRRYQPDFQGDAA